MVMDLVTEEEWRQALATAAPTREDDTVVISGGQRATLDEVKAYIAADLARRADTTNG